jgi:hypothetical protein
MKNKQQAVCALLAIALLTYPVSGRSIAEFPEGKDLYFALGTSTLAYGVVSHRIGRMVLSVRNDGTFGAGFGSQFDFFTGEPILSCEYPKGSNTHYLWAGAFWIGAVVGRDTLVSTAVTSMGFAQEFAPDQVGLGEIVSRSIISADPALREGAVSEEDYIMVYTDTGTTGIDLDYFGRPHIPLNIEVTQRSYAWSYSYAEDIVLFDYTIRNIGNERLDNVYMGIYVDGDVFFGQSYNTYGMLDDICGFIESLPVWYRDCVFWDTVNIAWIADNDGDPEGGAYGEQSVPHVTGTRIVRTPADSLSVSFNWWIGNYDPALDFGPRERANVGRWQEDFRDFGTGGLGTPWGDVNRYYQMRNMEFDYDQVYTASIGSADSLWLAPLPELAGDFADGYDTRYLLSFGPFDIDPGQRLPLSFAYVAGENFHVNPGNVDNLPDHPDQYYANIDFSDLGLNAAWAGRIYDNPGVDTDGDGYAGKVRLCCGDSLGISLDDILDTATVEFYDPDNCELIWYEGDGVPDFRGASPPPGPDFWLEPEVGRVRVRINGRCSETSRDIFSGLVDFEGYRIYVGRDGREASYSMVASYDIEDFDKLVWTDSDYELLDVPFTLDSLRCLYGLSCDDTLFDPTIYTRDNPYRDPIFADSVFYFEKQDFNASTFGILTPVRKTFPDQPYPSTLNADSADAAELTEDGYFKYFEYELIIDDLLPTVAYWFNVTAFDYGSPEEDMLPLESSVTVGAKVTYALSSADDVMAQDLKVFVYPNPYRSDGNYRDDGFEGRMESDRPDDRVRAIHFANLPPKCTISIYTLDGDLIREVEHDCDAGDPSASHDTWNLISRNTQMVTSGLYYWVVESEDGEAQVGKLVIIM